MPADPHLLDIETLRRRVWNYMNGEYDNDDSYAVDIMEDFLKLAGSSLPRKESDLDALRAEPVAVPSSAPTQETVETVRRLARSFSADWLNPESAELVPVGKHIDTLSTSMLAFHAVARGVEQRASAPVAVPSSAPTPNALIDAAEMLWIVLANVSGGDWTKQTAEWQEAAAHWRDNYFAAIKVTPATLPVSRPQGAEPERLEKTEAEREALRTALENMVTRLRSFSDSPLHWMNVCPARSTVKAWADELAALLTAGPGDK